jgi:hypothetical protein
MKPDYALQRLCIIAALALFGCATAPKPTANVIRTAANAVAAADDARAADYDAEDMHSARQKLDAARALARQAGQDPSDPNAVKARWLAEEASADAALAEAKASNVRAQSVLRSLQGAPAATDVPTGPAVTPETAPNNVPAAPDGPVNSGDPTAPGIPDPMPPLAAPSGGAPGSGE